MEHIRESINKSKKWKFDRRIIHNNKYICKMENGLVSWEKINDNKFNYLEKGKLNFVSESKKLDFQTNLVFVFNKNKYSVFKENGDLFYKSNSKNKSVNYLYGKKYVIEVKKVNNIITTSVEVSYDDKIENTITNYHLK